jgi:hypothetical protein
MRAGDLVRHRDIGIIGILIKRNTESLNQNLNPWLVSLQGYGGHLATWFSVSITVINESR